MKSNIVYHLNNLGKILDQNLTQYDRILLVGDFNLDTTEKHMVHFHDISHLKNLVKETICFKNPNKSSCIGLFLKNCSKSFQETQVVEIGLSDFHIMNGAVLKIFYTKQKHNTVSYRYYKTFESKKFGTKLETELMKSDINNTEFQTFHYILLSALNENAPLKQNFRANNAGFITKDMRKDIMKRSQTEHSRVAYNKQRNLCSSLPKN